MSCVKPNIVDLTPKQGNPIFMGPADRYINWEYRGKNQIPKKLDKGEKENRQANLKANLAAGKWALTPCGNCIECRKAERRNWANRLTLEGLYHKSAIFATFTYNDENIPHGTYCNKETGEVITENYTLYYEDMQKFWKRLRRYANYHNLPNASSIKFYCCGEYGTKTHRPHYHAIIYDFDIDTKKIELMSMKRGRYVWKSQEIEELWSKGYTEFEDINWNNCAYVAGYCMKKIGKAKDRAKIYEIQGQAPEKRWMSNGIGEQYVIDHWREIYPNDNLTLPNGRTGRPPRMFDNWYDKIMLGYELNTDDYNEFEEAEANLFRVHTEAMRKVADKRHAAAQAKQEAIWHKCKKDMDEYWNDQKEIAMKQWAAYRSKV